VPPHISGSIGTPQNVKDEQALHNNQLPLPLSPIRERPNIEHDSSAFYMLFSKQSDQDEGKSIPSAVGAPDGMQLALVAGNNVKVIPSSSSFGTLGPVWYGLVEPFKVMFRRFTQLPTFAEVEEAKTISQVGVLNLGVTGQNDYILTAGDMRYYWLKWKEGGLGPLP
jgi:hypothetical protein